MHPYTALYIPIQHYTPLYNTPLYTTIHLYTAQNTPTQYCTPLYSTIHQYTALYTPIQYYTPLYSTIHPYTVLYSPIQHSTPLYSTKQPYKIIIYSTIHHKTTPYSTIRTLLMVWEREVLRSSRIICWGDSRESRLGTPFPVGKVLKEGFHKKVFWGQCFLIYSSTTCFTRLRKVNFMHMRTIISYTLLMLTQ